MALDTRACRPWSRASVDCEWVRASRRELILETTVAVRAQVSSWSLRLASFLRTVRVRERHWLMDSGDDAVLPLVLMSPSLWTEIPYHTTRGSPRPA